jgi:hypothetical protein
MAYGVSWRVRAERAALSQIVTTPQKVVPPFLT